MSRRKFPRANYPCNITVKRKNQSDRVSTKTENIGIGGICVVLPKDLGIFAPVEVQLDLLDAQPVVNCDATIVWIVERRQENGKLYDTGIEFTNIKRKDSDRINFIVDKILDHRDPSSSAFGGTPQDEQSTL